MPKTRTPTPPLKERKHFDVLETSGRNTIPGKDFSSNHNIYSPETNISPLLPGHQSPRQGWHGLFPFNLTIPPSPRASRHVTKIYRSTMKQRHAQSLLLLACQPATDWLLESNGYGSTFPFIIPEILFRGGRGGLLTVIRKSNLLLPSSLFSSRGKKATRPSFRGEPSGASIKDSFEDLSRLNRRGNRVCVNVTADHQLASPRQALGYLQDRSI